MNKTFKLETTSFFLHIFAMAAMLCDHLWATLVPGNDWLTCVGRLASPSSPLCWWRATATREI